MLELNGMSKTLFRTLDLLIRSFTVYSANPVGLDVDAKDVYVTVAIQDKVVYETPHQNIQNGTVIQWPGDTQLVYVNTHH